MLWLCIKTRQKPIWADTQSRYTWECSIIKAVFITALPREALTAFIKDWSEWIIKHINAVLSFLLTTMLWPLKTISSALKHHSCWGGKNPFLYAHGFSTDGDVHEGTVDIRGGRSSHRAASTSAAVHVFYMQVWCPNQCARPQRTSSTLKRPRVGILLIWHLKNKHKIFQCKL